MRAIQSHVAPGSIVHTNHWKGYCLLESEFDEEHRTVNHSKTFKDPDTGAHSNTIEGTNYGLKLRIAPCNRVKVGIDEHLIEFIWR